MNRTNFNSEDINKYTNYMITSSKYRTPPYNWSGGIFQTFKPISGEFKIGNNYNGNMECVNNQTGREFYANPCGYWDNTVDQFHSGKIIKNDNSLVGSLFPVNKISDEIMIIPQDTTVFGYARIGEEMRSR